MKILFTLLFVSYQILYSQTSASADSVFAREAAEAGLMEVKLGELAQSKAKSEEVKNLGKHMVTDHTKANAELKAMAAKKGMKLPTTLSKDGQKHYDHLSKLNGEEFDKAYAKMMVEDHEKVIKKFKHEADNGKDADMKALASKTLPTLEHHLTMAKEAHDKVKQEKKSNG